MNNSSLQAKFPAILILAVISLSSCGRNPRLAHGNISAVMNAMTLEEKVSLVLGSKDDSSAEYATVAEKRLGVPSLKFVRPSGCYGTDSISFPCNAALAASWDMALIEEVASEVAFCETGSDDNSVLLAPQAGILRNPLAGIASECFSEDPLVAGKASASYVNGVHRVGARSAMQGFGADNQTTNAQKFNVVASPRALREIYLRGCELAIEESSPEVVMAASNRINGRWAAASADLITTILRDEWGFDGLVATANAGCESAYDMLAAGCDFIAFGSEARTDTLLAAFASDSITVDMLDNSVARLLALAAAKKGRASSDRIMQHEHSLSLTRRAASDAVVLLENRYGALPISDSLVESIAIFETADSAGIAEPLGNELAEMGFNIVNEVDSADMAFVIISRKGGVKDRPAAAFNLSAVEREMIEKVCGRSHRQDKFVAVVLNVDAAVETASWKELPDAILFAQQTGSGTAGALADIITGVVNPSARLAQTLPVRYSDVPSAKNFPSQFAGRERAELPEMAPMAGRKAAPGSALGAPPASEERPYAKVPKRPRSGGFKAVEHKNNEEKTGVRNRDYFLYQEGIYVGYRYYDSFNKSVSYPFGHGLSYTDFNYGEADVQLRKNSLKLMIDITNTGSVQGREVVQVYVVAPEGSLDKPALELKGFAKTSMLMPGETECLAIELPFRLLAGFNESSASWSLDAGTYIIKTGASSHDIRSETAVVIDRRMTFDVHDVLNQSQSLGELHARNLIFHEKLNAEAQENNTDVRRPEAFDPYAPAPADTLAVQDSAAASAVPCAQD